MPIIIHDRDAHEETMEILKEERAFETKVLLHCYSGSAEMAKQYVKLGAMISIPGTITFKNARKQVEVVQSVPLESLLIETDAPYLTPVPFRGKRNDPGYLYRMAQRLGELRGLSQEEMEQITMENGKRLYRIA